MREPYPLQWPAEWKRTSVYARERSRFGKSGHVSFAMARRHLLTELERLGAANVVLTSDLPVRADGLPYANGRAEDPGVAVWFVLADTERVFACDKWRTHAENMHAIAKSIEALRGLDRWGAGDVVTRAFAGFAALPPGSGDEVVPPGWRDVLGVAAGGGDKVSSRAELLALAKNRYRQLMAVHHPDRGGDSELAARINAAMAAAEAELGGA